MLIGEDRMVEAPTIGAVASMTTIREQSARISCAASSPRRGLLRILLLPCTRHLQELRIPRRCDQTNNGYLEARQPNRTSTSQFPFRRSSCSERIAAFLDRKTAAIDALIAKKERLIELLQEKRQALITQAVTKGLDASVPMKESGMPVAREGPRDLEDCRREADSVAKAEDLRMVLDERRITEKGVRLIRTGDVRIGRSEEQGFRYVSEIVRSMSFAAPRLHPGDVLICRLDGPVGRRLASLRVSARG